MSKIEYKYPVDVMVTKIFKIYHILSESSTVSSEESTPLVLLLLTMYKDGLIHAKSNNNHDSFDKFQETIDAMAQGQDKIHQYQDIVQIMRQSLAKINNHAYNRICYTLCELDEKFLNDNFVKVFDDVLYRVSRSQGRFAGEFIQPVELTRLMIGLADLKEHSKIFNPFAGLASLGVYLDQSQSYYGQELNPQTWALGVLRILAYNRQGNSNYVCEDSILNWPDQSEKFDLIVANPPWGMRYEHQYRNVYSDTRNIEHYLIERGLQSLNGDGSVILLLPQGFLSRGIIEQRVREHIVNSDLLDTIITLPDGIMLNTGVPIVILVLKMNKKHPGKVRFVKGDKFVVKKSLRETILNDYELIKVLNNKEIDSDSVRMVSMQNIKDMHYNLNLPRYFQKKISGEKLGKLLEFVRGERVSQLEFGKLVSVRDLKDDKIDFTLDVSTLEDTGLRSNGFQLVSESCLLVASRGMSIKPTIFELNDVPILKRQDIFAFKVNDKFVDKAYLINELHADYVLEQIESYRIGVGAMQVISKNDFLEVVIKLPSIGEQRAKIQGIYELSDKIKLLQDERNSLAHGTSVNQYNEFASLKHTLGTPRENILDWSDNLLDFFNNNQDKFKTLNKEFAEFYEIDIVSVMKEIKRDINFITDVLEKGENGFVLSEYEKETIPLSEINNIINHLSNNSFNFWIKKFLLECEKPKERGIYANKTLFKALLDNILTNANKYAFDNKVISNEVVFELTEVDNYLILEIKNNGKPFPKNFDREKFITKFSTASKISGSGLGGYDIHRIASDFNNPEWVLSLNEDPLYPVVFKFQFSIILIN